MSSVQVSPDNAVDPAPGARQTMPSARPEQALLGRTVVVLGGSSGIGLETARQVRRLGGDVVLTGRDPDRLQRAATEVAARSGTAFDATDTARLDRFFAELPGPVDHVLLTAGSPYYARLADLDLTRARREVDEHLWLPLHVARATLGRITPGGSLLLVSGTAARRPAVGLTVPGALTAASAALTANLALELAPVRVNLIAAGFVDTPLSARLLGEGLDGRRDELRATLPIRRVVEEADVAALAVHLMTNSALTGAVYDVDGGQQLLPGAGS
jgi:NAD(P)-dependent dehydrogenase (short-subunit alcohol dehydrogenase family)